MDGQGWLLRTPSDKPGVQNGQILMWTVSQILWSNDFYLDFVVRITSHIQKLILDLISPPPLLALGELSVPKWSDNAKCHIDVMSAVSGRIWIWLLWLRWNDMLTIFTDKYPFTATLDIISTLSYLECVGKKYNVNMTFSVVTWVWTVSLTSRDHLKPPHY